MSLGLFKSISQYLNTRSDFKELFIGGIWADEAPSGTPFPYVKIDNNLGNLMTRRTSTSEYRIQYIGFEVYNREIDGVDCRQETEDLGNQLQDILEYDDANYKFPVELGYVLDFQPARDTVVRSGDEKSVWVAELGYEVKRRTTRRDQKRLQA